MFMKLPGIRVLVSMLPDAFIAPLLISPTATTCGNVRPGTLATVGLELKAVNAELLMEQTNTVLLVNEVTYP